MYVRRRRVAWTGGRRICRCERLHAVGAEPCRLIEHVRDERLMKAFTVLEENSAPVYSAWRATKDFSLEHMRQALIGLRSRGTDCPPSL